MDTPSPSSAPGSDRFTVKPMPLGHRVCFLLGIGAMVAASVILSPILVPIAWALNFREQRRLRRFAQRLVCTTCGRQVGDAGVRLAAERHRDAVSEWMRKNPGMRTRFVERYNAACAGCGAMFMIDTTTGEAEPVSPEEAAFPRG